MTAATGGRLQKQRGLNRLIPPVSPSGHPAFVQTDFMALVVDQINRNTIAIGPPRDVTDEGQEVARVVEWLEVARETDTVVITDPAEPTNTVTIKRTTKSTMVNTETGDITILTFDNSLA